MRTINAAAATLGVLACLVSAARPARADGAAAAAGRMAALVLKTGEIDQDLADNLTEVLIARLAQTRKLPLVGKEKLRAQMGTDERRALSCITDMSCVGAIGVELGVTRMVVGTLGKKGGDYLYNLNLVDVSSGRTENRVFELVPGNVDALIAAVQKTADRLFEPKVEPGAVRVAAQVRSAMVYLDDAFVGTTPVRREGIEPGAHLLRVEKEGHRGWSKEVDVPAGSTLEITVPLSALPERRRWPGPLAVATTGLAVATSVVGVVLGVLSQQALAGDPTRVDAVTDTQRRQRLALTADGLFIASGALALTALLTTVIWRHDIFGTRTDVAEAPLGLRIAQALSTGIRF